MNRGQLMTGRRWFSVMNFVAVVVVVVVVVVQG
jgi:hypothetical protein